MADPCNTDTERAFALVQGPLTCVDDQVANVVGSQTGALRLRGQICIVTQAVNGGNCVLPSIGLGDAPPFMVVVNEAAVTIRVGCPAPPPGIPAGTFPADTMNGAATTPTFSAGFVNVPSKDSAIFIASASPFGKRGSATTAANNWHGAAFA